MEGSGDGSGDGSGEGSGDDSGSAYSSTVQHITTTTITTIPTTPVTTTTEGSGNFALRVLSESEEENEGVWGFKSFQNVYNFEQLSIFENK